MAHLLRKYCDNHGLPIRFEHRYEYWGDDDTTVSTEIFINGKKCDCSESCYTTRDADQETASQVLYELLEQQTDKVRLLELELNSK
jgi:hypothetical protein